MKVLFIITLFLCSIITTASAEKILIIESYHPVLVWTDQCEQGIHSVLSPNHEIRSFFMDTKRIPRSEFSAMADLAWETYVADRPDLVMIGDDNALQLLGKKLAKTETPVVYFGINNNPRKYFDRMPDNMTGVLERTPILPWLSHLNHIVPSARRALVIMDKSPTSDALLRTNLSAGETIKINKITAEFIVAENWSHWQSIVKQSESFDILIMPTFHSVKAENGEYISIEDVIAWTSENTPVPLFSNQDYVVNDKGATGSYVIYGEAHGRLAGTIALEILEENKSPKDIANRTDSEGKFYFNQTQLDRFNITLPTEIARRSVFK